MNELPFSFCIIDKREKKAHFAKPDMHLVRTVEGDFLDELEDSVRVELAVISQLLSIVSLLINEISQIFKVVFRRVREQFLVYFNEVHGNLYSKNRWNKESLSDSFWRSSFQNEEVFIKRGFLFVFVHFVWI